MGDCSTCQTKPILTRVGSRSSLVPRDRHERNVTPQAGIAPVTLGMGEWQLSALHLPRTSTPSHTRSTSMLKKNMHGNMNGDTRKSTTIHSECARTSLKPRISPEWEPPYQLLF